MKKHRCLFSALIFLVCYTHFQSLQAQAPVLSAADAVKIALESNYDIRLSRADADIARLNDTKGNAGMLPTVNFVANENITLSAFQQQLANGSEFVASGAFFNNANAGVQLSWTLFDGHRMQLMKSRLEQNAALGQLNLQSMVQTTAANVLLAYYEIVRGKMQERALAEVIVLNEERLRIAEARLTAGFAAQTDALQARIDLNQRRSDLLLQQNATATAKRSLNRLLVRAPETAFEVDETLDNTYSPNKTALTEQVLAQNPTLISFQKSAEIAAILVDETRTLGKARLTGISQLNALRTDNGAGFALNNTQAGITVGASFVAPLYSGGNVKRQVQTAQVAAEQAKLRVENQRAIIETELENQLSSLQVQQQILGMEDENVRAARENLSVSTARFRVGTTNGLEPQTAQNSLEQVLIRRNMALYNLKVAELRIRLLAGDL
jgi:outer membrane protein TolC